MKNILSALSLTLSLALVSCGGSAGPVGNWTIDGEATAASVKATMEKSLEGKSDAEKAMAQGMMGPMVEQMKNMKADMELKADNTFIVHADNPDGTHSDVKGTWKVDGDKITMIGKEDGKDKEETMTGTIAGNTITLTMSEGGMDMSMVFNKK